MKSLIRFNLSALALVEPPSLPLFTIFLILAVHGLGLFALARLTQTSSLVGILVIATFAVAVFIPRVRELLSPGVLAPFLFLYVGLALRFVLIRLVRGDVPGYFEYALPDVRVLLHFEFLIAAAGLYSVLIFTAFVFKSRMRAIALGTVILAGALLGWAAAEYFGHRTAGSTGSDPYAYVQMAVDMVTRFTPAHWFALFPAIAATDLPWFPILHVGYHLPYNSAGDAITVWAPAGSVAYALAYRVAGEAGLYVVNPFFSLVSALAAGLLAWELTRGMARTRRIVTALGTGAILLTSNEVVVWAGVTMVDAQGLVFSVLAIYCALGVYRTGARRWAIAAGVTLGIAYLVRHTQLVLVLAFLPLFQFAPNSTRQRLLNLILMGAAAFALSLPDLWYHQLYLGNWLHPESEELALFSLNAVLPTLSSIATSAFAGFEFGWLAPFILLGIVLYVRRAPLPNFALLLWLGSALAVQLPYAALRLRDLLPEFPIVAFYAVYGCGGLVALLWQRQNEWVKLLAAGLIFLGLELGVVRIWSTLPRVVEREPVRFGAMTAMQRAAFDRIEQLTPSNAIVGASLNSGAIDLYAHRATFRPADWSGSQLREFLSIVKQRDVYLLEDDASLENVQSELQDDYHVEPVTKLDVPWFGDQADPNLGMLWKIESN